MASGGCACRRPARARGGVALLVQPNEKLVELLLLAETARSLGARH
jgi:hypothetical protein